MLLARRYFRRTCILFFTFIGLFTLFYHRRQRPDFLLSNPPLVEYSTNSASSNRNPVEHAPSATRPATSPVSSDSDVGPKLNDTLYLEPPQEEGLALWRSMSEAAFRTLRSCLEANNCTENEGKVVIVESMYFRNYMHGDIGGENIWARSTMTAMGNLGYTVLYVENLREAVRVYRLLPDLVKIVIIDEWHSFDCWRDKQNCWRSEQNPTGIPGYKLLSFAFFPVLRHPLGSRWVLSPEPYSLQTEPGLRVNNTYLGYSIEESCSKLKAVSNGLRPSPPRAWLLAKLLSYFVPEKNEFRAWSKEDLDSVAEQTGIQFMMAAVANPPDDEIALAHVLPDEAHYFNHGQMKQPQFMENLAQSKVLIGMGLPIISPTPWNALCLGVPYVNPVHVWDADNPDDSSKWHSQHPIAALESKPYVYNVRQGDREGLIAAVKDALANPIEPYIPERMRMASIEKRLADIVDTDLKEEERKLAQWCNGPCGCQQPCDA